MKDRNIRGHVNGRGRVGGEDNEGAKEGEYGGCAFYACIHMEH
jgi:hypothetical protein